jgi:hypothetical protein
VEIQPGGLERRLHPVVMHGQGLEMASNMIYNHMDLAWIVHDLPWSELELDMVLTTMDLGYMYVDGFTMVFTWKKIGLKFKHGNISLG